MSTTPPPALTLTLANGDSQPALASPNPSSVSPEPTPNPSLLAIPDEKSPIGNSSPSLKTEASLTSETSNRRRSSSVSSNASRKSAQRPYDSPRPVVRHVQGQAEAKIEVTHRRWIQRFMGHKLVPGFLE